MVPNVPAAMQAAIAVPAVMAAATSMRVAMAVTAPDLEHIGSTLDMFGGRGGRACRANSRKGKSRGGGPGDHTYFHGSSFELIAADNGAESIWFPPV